jgi:hypothetical protein
MRFSIQMAYFHPVKRVTMRSIRHLRYLLLLVNSAQTCSSQKRTILPMRPFIPRNSNASESICTACFVTVTFDPATSSLAEAEASHVCSSLNMTEMYRQISALKSVEN